MFEKVKEVVEDYKGKDHVRGLRDCNLMVLKIFDEENYEKMRGRYSTITGGIRASKRAYGVVSMYEYLVKNNDFKEVPKDFIQPFDVIAFPESHNIYLCLGQLWFGVNDFDEFGVISPSDYADGNYMIFRKE
ncbi:hypothetical protein F2P58_23475 [Vibrio fortis]|uniref:DUF6950 domain-containing protein n=1 Tax=Vibrio fortis TaxID=212667 RepID=A0A5N3QTF6_9VIBR|nr:hypothetical protein [Vibrio fortis]KAB0285474.1 hypothetical protein F2P58_23475 [Vibrio fortis]